MKRSGFKDIDWDYFFNRILWPTRMLYYWLSFLVVWIFFRFKYGLKVMGRENIPRRGCFIVAPNHESHLDPPLIGVCFRGRPLRYFAKIELFKTNPLFNLLIRSQGAIPISPNPNDLKKFFRWINYFKRTNQPFVIFPEGERTPNGNLLPAKPGIGFVVQMTGLPVVPVFIEGTYEALPRGATRLSDSRIIVSLGRPIDFVERYGIKVGKQLDKSLAKSIGDDIMSRIKDLSEEVN